MDPKHNIIKGLPCSCYIQHFKICSCVGKEVWCLTWLQPLEDRFSHDMAHNVTFIFDIFSAMSR